MDLTLCRMGDSDVGHPFWARLGASAWQDSRTVSMRDAVRKCGHGSTAGAKLIAAGVIPTVPVPGYQHPRVSLASVELLVGCPELTRADLAGAATTFVVRCGGPQRAGLDPGELVQRGTGRSWYGFHRTMTRRQAVNAAAAWWSVPARTLGVRAADIRPDSRLEQVLTDLLVTVGGMVVLHGRIVGAVAGHPRLEAAHPLVAFELGDPAVDLTGTWLPPTRSGNVALRAVDW